MQKTIRKFTITEATATTNNGKLELTTFDHIVTTEYQPDKAIKAAQKACGYKFRPVSVKSEDLLFILDDEIFKTYAVIKGEPTNHQTYDTYTL